MDAESQVRSPVCLCGAIINIKTYFMWQHGLYGVAHFRCYDPPKEPELFNTESEAVSSACRQVGNIGRWVPGLPDINDHIKTGVGPTGKALFAIFCYYTEEGTKYYVTIL